MVEHCLRNPKFTFPKTLHLHRRGKPFVLDICVKHIKPKHNYAAAYRQDRIWMLLNKAQSWIHWKSNFETILSQLGDSTLLLLLCWSTQTLGTCCRCQTRNVASIMQRRRDHQMRWKAKCASGERWWVAVDYVPQLIVLLKWNVRRCAH